MENRAQNGFTLRKSVRSLVWLAWILLPLAAYAHAQLVRSNPANKAEVSKPPAQVELWFNELLETGFNSVQVYPAGQANSNSRTNLIEGKPQLDRKDGTHLISKVKPLDPGEYVVEWRVLSRDGHSAPGRITFRVLAHALRAKEGQLQ
jgi:methionine-rich copper-binding protein CopC